MNFFWPDIQDSTDAHKACGQAAGVAFFIAIVTGVVAGLQASGKINILPGVGTEAFIDAGLFLIIGIGLAFHSRIAALAGLLLYIAERIFMAKANGMKPAGIGMAIVFTLAFISGVRGAFAWHEIRKLEKAADGAAEEEVKAPPSKSKKILSTIIWFFISAGVIAGGFYFIKSQSGKQASQVSVTTSQNTKEVPASASAPAGDAAQAVKTAGGRTFHLKSGETLSGKVIQDDPVFYTVETFGGKQKIIIKEDIASEE